jgi:moderate conductance mechanosensitive channel
MKKSKKVTIRSVIFAAIGAILLVSCVLRIHNQILCNNQYSNNHEKLELIEEKIEKSKEDEGLIEDAYEEMYQSKADSLAFQLKYITDIDLNVTYAEEMREVYDINYLSIIEDGKETVDAGTKMSEDDDPIEYTSKIDDTRSIFIQIDRSTMDSNVQENASLQSVLENITVGKNGYVLAFNANDGTVLYSPTSEDIGKQASDFGLEFSRLSDGKDLTFTYGDTEFIASCKQVDDGMIVTVVPYSEITSTDTQTAILSLIIYIIFMNAVILYSTFLEEEIKKNKDEKAAKKILNKRIGLLVSVATILSFGVTFYMNTLFTLSDQSITNTARSSELLDALKDNDDTVTKQTAEYNEQYSQKLNELAYIIKNVDSSYLTMDFMSDLKDALKVNSVMYFDLEGKVIASNTDNWSYTISTNPDDQSYEYWQILNGSKTTIIQDIQINDNGNLRQYMGKAIQDENHRTVGMVTISTTPEQIAKNMINTDSSSVLSGVSTGNKGFAFAVTKPDDDGNSTFVYFPREALIDKNVTTYGMTSAQLVSGYNDFIKIDGTNYYCASSEYNDMITYIAVPFTSMNITAFPVSLTTSIILVIFMSVLWYMYNHVQIEYDEDEENEEQENEQIDVQLANGRVTKTRSILYRWTHNSMNWRSRTAGQKTSHVLHLTVTIISFVTIILVIFKDSIFDEDSLFRFIMSTRWQKGINIFSISYSVIVCICVIEISIIVRKAIMWIAHNLNAQGETICRLADNFIKFATTLGLLYFVFSSLGANTTSLVTSASILTLIVGLGSQSLISDILAGLFIVYEGEFQVGDIVTIDGFRGTVVEIGVRTTKVKEGGGNVKIFSNNSVKNVLNMTKDYSYVVCDVGIEYGEDLRYVEKVLREEFPNIQAKLPTIVDGPFYRGVSEFGDNAIVIKIIAKCKESDRVQLDRDLRRRILLAFDEHNINIPYPQIVLNQPTEIVHESTHKEERQAETFVKEQSEEFKDTGIKEE